MTTEERLEALERELALQKAEASAFGVLILDVVVGVRVTEAVLMAVVNSGAISKGGLIRAFDEVIDGADPTIHDRIRASKADFLLRIPPTR